MRYFEAAKIGGHDNGWIRNIRENSEILLEVTIIGWRDEVFSFFFFFLFCFVLFFGGGVMVNSVIFVFCQS